MYEEIAGRAALQVTAPAKAAFPRGSRGDGSPRVPGVQAAVPSYQRATRIVFEHKWLALIAIGIDPVHDSDAREYELREGRFSDARRTATAACWRPVSPRGPASTSATR